MGEVWPCLTEGGGGPVLRERGRESCEMELVRVGAGGGACLVPCLGKTNGSGFR